MTSAFRSPLPRMGVAWPPDPGLQRTLILSLVGHGLLIFLLFLYLNNWLPNEPLNPVYRVEIMGLESVVPEVPPTPVEPLPLPPEAVLPPPVAVEPPLPKVEPAPQQPLAPHPAPVATPVRELPQPQQPAKRFASNAIPTQPLPESQVVPVRREVNEPDLNAPRLIKPVASARPQSVQRLDDNNVIAIKGGGATLDAPSTSRTFQQRAPSATAALPDAVSHPLPAATRSADIMPAPAVRTSQPSALRNPVSAGLPAATSSALPAATRNATDLAPPAASVGARPQPSKVVAPAVPAEQAMTLSRRSGPNLAAPVVSVGGGTAEPTPRSTSSPGLTDTGTRVGAPQTGVKIDQASLDYFRKLRTCLNAEEEFRLKTRLATLLVHDDTCLAGGTHFFVAAPDDAYSLRVGLSRGSGPAFRDRCEALRAAVQCFETR